MSADELLRAYLTAGDDGCEGALCRLCSEVLLPRCRLVVRARLWRYRDEVEDVTHDVVLRLVRRLRQMRAEHDLTSVRCATEWAAGAAARTCSEFLRKEHPLRTRLANALRYQIGKSVVFGMWRAANRRLVCGWRKCRSAEPLTELAFRDLVDDPRVAARVARIDPEENTSLWRPLAALFACANGPVYFHALVAEFGGRSFDRSMFSTMDDVVGPAELQQTDERAVRQELLGALWRGVMQLPRQERLALLLNLRGTEGLSTWTRHGVISIAEVAAAVELRPAQLGELPVSDFEIAERLGFDDPDPVRRRQRVINLRRSARRRLADLLK